MFLSGVQSTFKSINFKNLIDKAQHIIYKDMLLFRETKSENTDFHIGNNPYCINTSGYC